MTKKHVIFHGFIVVDVIAVVAVAGAVVVKVGLICRLT
jgi:hypothetical protein